MTLAATLTENFLISVNSVASPFLPSILISVSPAAVGVNSSFAGVVAVARIILMSPNIGVFSLATTSVALGSL